MYVICVCVCACVFFCLQSLPVADLYDAGVGEKGLVMMVHDEGKKL